LQYNLEFGFQHLEGLGYSERLSLRGWVLEWIPPSSVTVDGFELQYGVGSSESIFNSASEAIRSSDWFSDSNEVDSDDSVREDLLRGSAFCCVGAREFQKTGLLSSDALWVHHSCTSVMIVCQDNHHVCAQLALMVSLGFRAFHFPVERPSMLPKKTIESVIIWECHYIPLHTINYIVHSCSRRRLESRKRREGR
jgi:hypothetical protein